MNKNLQLERKNQVMMYFQGESRQTAYIRFVQLAGGTEAHFGQAGVYLHAITECRKTEAMVSIEGGETHHILPRFAGGTDNAENKIRVTYSDHQLLHLLRYVEFGARYDLSAAGVRHRRIAQGFNPQLFGKQLDLENRRLQRGWYNSELQAELGRKGGKVGGSRNTFAQQKARTQPKPWAASVGRGNQSKKTAFLLKHQGVSVWMAWQYQKHSTSEQRRFFISAQYSSFSDLALALVTARDWQGSTEDLTPALRQAIANAACQRGKQAGWTCLFMVTTLYTQATFDAIVYGPRSSIYVQKWNLHVVFLSHYSFTPALWIDHSRCV